MAQYGFFFDQGRCYGCKACSVACKDWYDIAPGPEKWMSVYMWEKNAFPLTSIGILAFSLSLIHIWFFTRAEQVGRPVLFRTPLLLRD